MKVEVKIVNGIGDLGCSPSDVIRRSPVAAIPNAEKILHTSLERSEIKYMVFIDDEVACVFGLIPPTIMSDTAYVWLMTTNLTEQHPFILVRKSQIILKDMQERYAHIEGHVFADQDRSIRWLKWLGFEMGALEKGRMIRFELRRAS